jgi:hypothetical protein
MSEILIGDFNLIPEVLPPEGQMKMVVKPIDMVTYWRRCGSVSNFIADFYKITKNADFHENLISTIFNELIENASKYSTKRDSEIFIDVKLYNTILKIQIKNTCNKTNYFALYARLEKLLSTSDLDELYLTEMIAKSRGDLDSGIGLLLILKDYNIKIGAKFEEHPEKDLFDIIFQVYYYMEEVN